MARKKDQAVTRTGGSQSSLLTPEARAQLPYLVKPLWYRFGKGQFLGYGSNRRLPGTWFARIILETPDGKEDRRQVTLGLADDVAGITSGEAEPLSYTAALTKAIAWCDDARKPESCGARAGGASRTDGTYFRTLGECIDFYSNGLDIPDERSRKTAKGRHEQIKREIGDWVVSEMEQDHLDNWRKKFIKMPPMLRRKEGGEAVFRKNWDPADPENIRARKCTCNRWLADIKAALTATLGKNGAASSLAWDAVKAFKKVEKSRGDAMSSAEVVRFLNSCWPEFRPLAFGALATAARYSELRTLTVGSFRRRTRCIVVEAMFAKNGKLRHVPLTDEGVAFFMAITRDRQAEEPMFVRANGQPWTPSQQYRPMKGVTEDVDIDSCFYGLRHTRITQLIEDGMEYSEVADIAGTSEQMIRKYYSHVKPHALRKRLNARSRNLGVPQEQIDQAISELDKAYRMEEEDVPPFEFTLQELHPSAYAGKVKGGREDAPPPKDKPSAEALEALLMEDIPAAKIGQMFHVSGTTIRKWCQGYGIQPPGRGYHAKQRALRAAIAKAEAGASAGRVKVDKARNGKPKRG